jgi:hypothetical protein
MERAEELLLSMYRMADSGEFNRRLHEDVRDYLIDNGILDEETEEA